MDILDAHVLLYYPPAACPTSFDRALARAVFEIFATIRLTGWRAYFKIAICETLKKTAIETLCGLMGSVTVCQP